VTSEVTIQSLSKELLLRGFDLVVPFQLEWFNSKVKESEQLPSLSKESNLAILVGNTKAIWPHFILYLKKSPKSLEKENPFDEFVEREIQDLVQTLEIPSRIRYAHLPDPEHLPFQKLAECVGLAYVAKTHLAVHPQYGPWFSLRAVIQLDQTVELDCPFKLKNPCTDCETQCLPVFEKAASRQKNLGSDSLKETWQDWLLVRKSCPIGREYEFTREQLLYHYTKDKEILRKLL